MCYMLEQISQLLKFKILCGKGEKGIARCNLLLSPLGCCMRITHGQCGEGWETNECWMCWKTTSFTWFLSDKYFALGTPLHRALPCLCSVLPGSCVWWGLCGPEFQLTSSVNNRICISLKQPSPVLCVLVPPLAWTELNSSPAGSLPLTAHSPTGALHQLCPEHFSRDFVCILWMSVSWTSQSLHALQWYYLLAPASCCNFFFSPLWKAFNI